MPFNGAGSFVPIPAPDYPAVAGTNIIADYYNNVQQDVFDGLSNCLTRDGQSPPAGNLPMAGFKFTAAGAAVAAGQFLTWGQTGAALGDLNVDGGTLFVDAANDRVGIGTNAPTNKLHIFEPTATVATAVIRAVAGQAARWIITGNALDPSSQGFHLGQNADGSAGVFNAFNAHMAFSTNGTEKMRILANGRVGISTNAPTELLDVNGNTVVRGVLTVTAGAGNALLAQNIYRDTSLSAGRLCSVSSNVNFGDASAFTGANSAQWAMIYNDSGSSITISASGGVTLRLAGTGVTGSRTLAPRLSLIHI